jgi:hypothetical protein
MGATAVGESTPAQMRALVETRACARRPLLLLAALTVLALTTACAGGGKVVSQSFSCDMWNDGWARTVDLLEYSYGDKDPMLSRRRPLEGRQVMGCGTINTAMPVAEFLHVKWRLKATGEVIEERVDLRGRLPKDMYMQKVTFVIAERQLFVYLVTPEMLKPSLRERPLRTWLSKFHVTYEIYPNNQLKLQDGRVANR